MFKKVLFCTDFSKAANNAFKYALRAASHNSAKLIIFHAMPEADAQYWKGYMRDNGEDKGDAAMQALKDKAGELYIPQIPEEVEYELAYRSGDAAQQILDFSKSNGIDLVVIGRQGAGGVRDLFFGNVAAKVAKAIHCPILIIP